MPWVERHGVLDAGRAPLVVETAVGLDRDAIQRDAKAFGLTVGVVEDAQRLPRCSTWAPLAAGEATTPSSVHWWCKATPSGARRCRP